VSRRGEERRGEERRVVVALVASRAALISKKI
jgi:hypothetical protein